MEFVVIIWLLFGLASAVVMSGKGRSSCAGFALGVFLGPFGLIIALVLGKDSAVIEGGKLQSGDAKKCPYCAEIIRVEAVKCRHCGSDLQKPMNAELASQLSFHPHELECYGAAQLDALDRIIRENDLAAIASTCEKICAKMGRTRFEGPPRDFLLAYYQQLKAYIDAR